MKMDCGSELISTIIKDISVGEVFFVNRKSIKEKGIYMKIDINNCLTIKKECDGYCYAVDLETGQIESFIYNAPVMEVPPQE